MEFDGSPPTTPTSPPQADPVEHTEDQNRPSRPLFARELIETALLTLFIFWLVNSATGRFRIEGFSMLPTLEEGEYIIINKLSYYLEEPERGDIIVLHFPNDRSRDFIKRIIGLPGDQVEVANGIVKVNGETLDEPYVNARPSYTGSWRVPEDHYFVLGDNRNNSSDSHNWSYLPREDIVGKAWVIYWEPDKWGLVPHFAHQVN